MSTEALLARLARLDAADRAWLLGELPPALRRELAGLLAEDEEAGARDADEAAPKAGTWESLEPQQLAALFETEPAWLVSAATRATESRWRERMLASMSTRRRHDVELADRTGSRLGARAAQWVLERCRSRLASGDVPSRSEAPKQGFAALLEQMKERFS